jgi:Putative transmembrane protein (PGPGW)
LLGLAVLATEYDWAARLFAGLRQRTSRMASPLADRLRVRRQTAEPS